LASNFVDFALSAVTWLVKS